MSEQQDELKPTTEFTKLVRISNQHHEWLNELKQHYLSEYGEDLPLTWLLYKAVHDTLANPKNRAPRYPILDALAKSRPNNEPVGKLFLNLETFMMMTNDSVITEQATKAQQLNLASADGE